jgi:hypothetical protein
MSTHSNHFPVSIPNVVNIKVKKKKSDSLHMYTDELEIEIT